MGWTDANWLYQPPRGGSGAAEHTYVATGQANVDTRLAAESWVGDPIYGDSSTSTPAQKLINALSQITTLTRLRLPASTYTLTINVDTGSNVILCPEPGAVLVIGDGATLTVSRGIECGEYQCFSLVGTGTISFSRATTILPEWFGASGDNSTDDLAAFVDAMATATADDIIRPAHTYYLSDTLAIASAMTIDGPGSLRFDKTNSEGLDISASSVKIKNITLAGPQYANYQPYERAIYVGGAVGAYLTGIEIENVTMTTWGGYGMRLEFCDGYRITNPTISNIGYIGGMTYSCQNGITYTPQVSNIVAGVGTTTSYGWSMTKGGGTLLDYPRPYQEIVYGGNFVDIIPGSSYSVGLDMHATDSCAYIGATVTNSDIGGSISYSDTDGDNVAWNSGFIGCIFDSGVTDGTHKNGIELSGASTAYRSTGLYAIGCTIRAHGSSAGNTTGGIYVNNTDYPRVHSNYIERCSASGIFCVRTMGGSYVGNTIVDPWATTASYSYGHGIQLSVAAAGYMDGNTIVTSGYSGAGKTVYTHGVYVANDADNAPVFGRNMISGYTTAAIWDARAGISKLYETRIDTVGGLGQMSSVKSVTDVVTLSGASGVIAVRVPAGCVLLGVQLRVDTAITSGDGATSWDATFAGGSTTTIITGQAFTKNTKADIYIVPEVATLTTDITITPDAHTFSGGVVRAIVHYMELTTMADAA